jgi:dynactin complex subunit
MSKVTKFAVGDRVQLIPFKHKGKQGSVKFIGEIEGKAQGNWVGIELDEPKGENNGEFNDE